MLRRCLVSDENPVDDDADLVEPIVLPLPDEETEETIDYGVLIEALPHVADGAFAGRLDRILLLLTAEHELRQEQVLGLLKTATGVTKGSLLASLKRVTQERKLALAAEEEAKVEAAFAKLPEWQQTLAMTAVGAPRANLSNLVTVMANAENLSSVLAWNDFTMAPEKVTEPPWTAQYKSRGVGPWEPEDNTRLITTLESEWSFASVPKALIVDAVDAVAQCRRFHPVRDFMSSLVWDGVPRLDTWLTDYLHVVDVPGYTRMVARKWLLSAVARTFAPGCQVDYVLVLEGNQRIGKTSALRVLANDDWHTEPELGTLEGKESVMLVQGALIVEFGEGHVVNKASAERLKSFISTKADDIVPKYANQKRRYPRGCVFAMTVNRNSEYLQDETGNARFLPVEVLGLVDQKGLAAAVGQLWAEAMVAYRAGEQWWPTTEELATAEAIQADRQTSDPWHGILRTYLEQLTPDSEVTVTQLLTGPLNVPVAQHELRLSRRVGRVLKQLGWVGCPRKGVRYYRMSVAQAERWAERVEQDANPPRSPEVTESLRRVGIPTYSDTGTGIVVDDADDSEWIANLLTG
jgi:predicted P-loop ATPase